MADDPFELEGVEPLKLIGTGGFGEVWLSLQTNIDRKVAMKVGHAPIDDETIQIRFERECIALGRLSGHPNIVDVFTAGLLKDGRPYLMLEYVSGGTLWQRLNRAKIDEQTLSRIGVELAAALSVAHTAGVLHRDLKPENVLLRPDGQAVLGDFGIARLHDSDNTTTHGITASVAYAPPEVLAGEPASMASDLYGIGICLLTAATQSVPFLKKADESVHPIINRVLAESPPDLSEYGYSEEFAAIVDQLLSKESKERPLSAEVVHELLAPLTVAAAAESPSTPMVDVDPESEPIDDLAAGGGATVEPTPSAARISQAVRTAPPSGSFRSSDSLAADLAPTANERTVAAPRRRDRSDAVRLLGATFGAVLLLGGLLVFALNRYTDFSFSTGSSDAGPPTASTTVGTSVSTTVEAISPEPLLLPLVLGDTGLSAESAIEVDTAGPNSSQFCDVTPTTTGLVDWVGETLADPVGYPLVYQQLARFETAEDASSYVSTYLPATSCTEWTIPASGDGPPIVLEPVRVAPAQALGDESGEVVFDGTSGDTELHGRVAIVRVDGVVYTLSINSLDEGDLDMLDELFALAVSRLDF